MYKPSLDTTKAGFEVAGYVLREQLAVGGFGTIWAAEHRDTGFVAAIKLLHSYLVQSEVLIKRFELEAEAITRMRHPNVVELYQQGRLPDGRPYLIMELLNGIDLRSRIATRGTLAPSEVLPILEQLCDALAAAHAQGIVHRDLKATNVFLSTRDGALRVVLFDFGIAKLLGDEGPQLTQSRTLLGSLACIAPEQITGRPVDERTDIYALGALLYHMLVGHPPFAGAPPMSILDMHLNDDPPPPSQYGDVPPAFDSVVLRAMSKLPQDRFPRVEYLLEAFRRALDQGQSDELQRLATAETTDFELVAQALGLYLDVRYVTHELEDIEELMLDTIEAAIGQVTHDLEERGFSIAYERGDAVLLVVPALSPVSAVDLSRQVLATARDLYQSMIQRLRSSEVTVTIYLHVDSVAMSGQTPVAGSLLRVSQWTASHLHSGVFATEEMRQLLGMAAEQVSSTPVLYCLPLK